MPKSLVVFDLDGTLVDSAPGIAASADAALAELGYKPLTEAQLRAFVGPPLRESFAGLPVSRDHLDELVVRYRHHYGSGLLHEVRVYDGISDLLAELHAQGCTLAIATSKHEIFAISVLEHVGLASNFAVICGSDAAAGRTTKREVLSHLLSRVDRGDFHQVLMVGDRHQDVDGALHHDLVAIGVSWGYGTEAELTQAGAHRVVSHPRELSDVASG